MVIQYSGSYRLDRVGFENKFVEDEKHRGDEGCKK